MAASTPLDGIELVDCARANAKQGIETAADLCGYGHDLNRFKQALQLACDRLGIEFHEVSDLADEPSAVTPLEGLDIAPDTVDQL